MVQERVLCSVLHLKCGHSCGTTFSLDYKNVQYLITAKHIFKELNYPKEYTIQVLLDNGYQDIKVEIFYHTTNAVDIAVMKPIPRQIHTPIFNNKFDDAGITWGQDVFFLGFPSFHTHKKELVQYNDNLAKLPDRNIPAPFIKKACLSGMITLEGDSKWLLLDGHNNTGFSGGPVCFKPFDSESMKICGVVTSFMPEYNRIYDNFGNEMQLYSRENSGIIHACHIKHCFEILDNM